LLRGRFGAGASHVSAIVLDFDEAAWRLRPDWNHHGRQIQVRRLIAEGKIPADPPPPRNHEERLRRIRESMDLAEEHRGVHSGDQGRSPAIDLDGPAG
jgi:hypothetical protein